MWFGLPLSPQEVCRLIGIQGPLEEDFDYAPLHIWLEKYSKFRYYWLDKNIAVLGFKLNQCNLHNSYTSALDFIPVIVENFKAFKLEVEQLKLDLSWVTLEVIEDKPIQVAYPDPVLIQWS